MRINKCYHIDGREMDKNYKIKKTDKIAKELLEFLSRTTTAEYSQYAEETEEEDVQNNA